MTGGSADVDACIGRGGVWNVEVSVRVRLKRGAVSRQRLPPLEEWNKRKAVANTRIQFPKSKCCCKLLQKLKVAERFAAESDNKPKFLIVEWLNSGETNHMH